MVDRRSAWAIFSNHHLGERVDLAHEIAVGNVAGMISVRMKTGANRTSSPQVANEKPTSEMGKLSHVFEILRHQA